MAEVCGRKVRFHPRILGESVKVFEAHVLILAIKKALRRGCLQGNFAASGDLLAVRAGLIELRPIIENLRDCCRAAGLTSSERLAERLLLFPETPLGCEDFFVGEGSSPNFELEVSRVAQSIADECSDRSYFSLGPDERKKHFSPLEGWESIVQRFPKVRYNIEESLKCFAFERYGAAVFHILQVAEYGVIQVGSLMGELGDKPGWSCLERLRRLISVPHSARIPLAQQHTKLLENVVPLAIVVKDSWRHKLDHVDNQIVWVDTDFSPNVAEEIIVATRGFMRKLALELP